ncbi:MAG: DegT/DnrJ/EryC1/StrS family aminotransferase [Cytophagaceae bacterium]
MDNSIPFLSLHTQQKVMESELFDLYRQLQEDAWFILGKQLSSFESKYADYSGVKHTVGVGNGFDALVISLKALQIGPEDEVIVPANSFIATISAVVQVGAIPILIDPNPTTYVIGKKEIEHFITNNTKAIIPVHLFGNPCPMDEILSLATEKNLFVIEDNAQAHGASFQNKKTGSFGHINATSFYPVKPLGAMGDGGAITTNDDKLAAFAQTYRNYGSSEKYLYEMHGVNSRLDEMQAGILSIKLKYLEQWNKEREAQAIVYQKELANVGDLRFQQITPKATSAYHVFTIQTEKRNELQDFLLKEGIQTIVHYPVPPFQQLAYSSMIENRSPLNGTQKLASTLLSLPLYNGFVQQEVVVDKIKKFYS